MNQQNSVNVNENNDLVKVDISNLISVIKTRQDCRWFALKNGKKYNNLILLGYFLPDISCFDTEFFFQCISSKKKVKFNFMK